MSLLTSSIDLDTITPPELSQFQPSQIEQLANLFLQAGDTVRPILLRKISPISFQILEGNFEYYAAMKAQEIDDQFTAIRAYVVPPNLESTILSQYQFLRSLSVPATVESITPPPIPQFDLAQIEQKISIRLEQKLTATIERTIEKRISSGFQAIIDQMTQQLNSQLLDFKQLLTSTTIQPIESTIPPIAPEPVAKKPSKTTKPAKTERTPTSKKQNLDDHDPKRSQVLNDLNTMNFADLERKLAQSKSGKFARPIDEQRLKRSGQKFTSIEDVIINVPKLAEKTMQKIIDAW